MLIGFVALLVSMCLTRGQSLLDLTYCKPSDTFYDFTHSIINARNIKEYAGMYPPLAQFFFLVLAYLLPKSYSSMDLFELINSPLGALYTLFFMMIIVVLLNWILDDQLRAPKWVKRLFLILLIFSAPFIYGWQRGNVLFLCLPLILVYTCYYDSEKAPMRMAAVAALAIAAGIKLYPAILGMLLVKERRWKQTLLCVGLGILAVVLPSFIFGGLEVLPVIAQRLMGTSAAYDARGLGHQAGFQNFVEIVNAAMGTSFNKDILLIFMIIFMIVIFFLAKRKWQQIAILSAAMILWPSLSFVYTMIFMAVPLLFFLNSDEKFTALDIWYCILFAAMFVAIPLGGQNAFSFTEGQYYMLNITTVVENIAINLLVLTMGVQVISEQVIRAFAGKRNN